MSVSKLLPVIMAGGSGSRLWPVSRTSCPKPFIKLSDGESFFQKTFKRASSLDKVEEIILVTREDLLDQSRSEISTINELEIPVTYILEPVARNTAAAIAAVVEYVTKNFPPETILLVLSADHLIDNEPNFKLAVSQAGTLANNNRIVLFGIEPDYPETAYGYLELDGTDVIGFKEKPKLEDAKRYVQAKRYAWNSGIFFFKATLMATELREHCPNIFEGVARAIKKSERYVLQNSQVVILDRGEFECIESISIDYAVMERSSSLAAVTANFGWADIGSWKNFSQTLPKDANGNRVLGDTILLDSADCIVRGNDRLISLLGVKNLIVVDTSDALLVCDVSREQDVRQIYRILEDRADPTVTVSHTVERPWGKYTVLSESKGYKVKRIEVNPGAALSLQRHRHRSEHWVVVSGIAQVKNGEELTSLRAGESTFIPAGEKHRLWNEGTVPCTIIETQTGSYLGEDDIQRFDDVYGRRGSFD